MAPAVRLDVVVQHRQRQEERARDVLQRADADVRAARQALAELKDQFTHKSAAGRDCDQWLLWELDAEHGRKEVQRAERAVDASMKSKEQAARAFRTAKVGTEAVRRVADARREELVLELSRKETRQEDEAARTVRVAAQIAKAASER